MAWQCSRCSRLGLVRSFLSLLLDARGLFFTPYFVCKQCLPKDGAVSLLVGAGRTRSDNLEARKAATFGPLDVVVNLSVLVSFSQLVIRPPNLGQPHHLHAHLLSLSLPLFLSPSFFLSLLPYLGVMAYKGRAC